ncbi:hypothetical protein [Vibrio cyclitrophicus]|uniref:hypothetical protein n=1 Tax=Vibrio cyclitrophicus TaxID=47951 RepID=UPI000C84E75A|nr:hypothetical protein [Vibrio cyclitrophicus]PMF33582.1 hypothetical protein BCV15_08150 [Vibrio cyclitrophicus]
MSKPGIDRASQKALQQFLEAATHKQAANGDVFVENVQVHFEATGANIRAVTELHICLTTTEYGKISCYEVQAENLTSDYCHVDFDAGWSNTTYKFNSNTLVISGSSPRFSSYTCTLTLWD